MIVFVVGFVGCRVCLKMAYNKFILDYRTKEEIELGLMNNSENLP